MKGEYMEYFIKRFLTIINDIKIFLNDINILNSKNNITINIISWEFFNKYCYLQTEQCMQFDDYIINILISYKHTINIFLLL